MFTVALFKIAKTWKQTKYPSTDEWIKMWHIYTMEYYSAIKKNKIMSFAATWMQLEIIILSEIRNRKTNTIWYHSYVESKMWHRASLVAQWLRIHLPMQEKRVQALVREDPTCRGATKPVCHNYWACEPQLLKPPCLEPKRCNEE